MKTKGFKISKKAVALMLGVFLYVAAPSQTSLEGWMLAGTKNNVSVYYKADFCSGDSVVFLRIVNSNPYNAVISWTLWGSEPANEFSLLGGEDLSGTCPAIENKNILTDLVDYIPAGKTIGDINPNVNIN